MNVCLFCFVFYSNNRKKKYNFPIATIVSNTGGDFTPIRSVNLKLNFKCDL